MATGIKKIYWITHPAFPMVFGPIAGKRFGRATPASVKEFINEKIKPMIEKASREPESVVVLVRTPTKIEMGKYYSQYIDTPYESGISTGRSRRASGVETELEKVMRKQLGNRAIVTRHIKEHDAAKEVRTKLRNGKFELARSLVIEAYGSWKELCAHDYPRIFKSQHGNWGRLVHPKNASIARAPREKKVLKHVR